MFVELWHDHLAVFVLEVGCEDAFPQVVIDLFGTPVAATGKFVLARSHLAVIDCEEDPHEFLLAQAFEDIVLDILWCVVGDTQFLTHLAVKSLLDRLAVVDMSATCRVPFVGLDVFPVRSLLQIEVATAIEYVQVYYRMEHLAAIVGFTACDLTEHVAVFVDDGKEFFFVIHTLFGLFSLLFYFLFCHLKSSYYLYIRKENTKEMGLMEVNLDLMSFIETSILPRYTAFGRSHGLSHVQRVIANSLELARRTGADINMVYTVAAYHDLGMSGPRAIHHITSGKILAADARLKKWFSPEQITIMKEAVEDHRASASHAPRSIYGKIVAEADRDLDPEVVFRRAVEFGLEHDPDKDREWQWQRFDHHMEEKYSIRGYIRLWIPNSPNEEKLKEVRSVIADKARLREVFNRLYDEECSSKH